MTKRRMTVSLDPEVAAYLESMPNRSAVVSDAVRAYRDREVEAELEAAYAQDRQESRRINAEWQAADAEMDDDELDPNASADPSR